MILVSNCAHIMKPLTLSCVLAESHNVKRCTALVTPFTLCRFLCARLLGTCVHKNLQRKNNSHVLWLKLFAMPLVPLVIWQKSWRQDVGGRVIHCSQIAIRKCAHMVNKKCITNSKWILKRVVIKSRKVKYNNNNIHKSHALKPLVIIIIIFYNHHVVQ